MGIISIDDEKYAKYERMILERDRCRKEAKLAETRYIHTFGDLITAVFKQKIECISLKKMLSYCLSYVNRNENIDLNNVLIKIKVEMTQYHTQLKEMIAENEMCKKLEKISESDALRVKQIYRRIAKKLHPDLNPQTEQHEELLELWQRNVIAYRCNNLEELEAVEVLTEQALANLGQEKTLVDIPDIDEKIEEIRKEIKKIKSTDPYLYRIILNDNELIKEKKRELQDELNEYKEYTEQLKRQLKEFITDEGMFNWTIGQN